MTMGEEREREIEFPSDSSVDPSWRQTTDERQDASGTGRNELGIRKQFQKRRKHLGHHHCRAATTYNPVTIKIMPLSMARLLIQLLK